MNSTQTTMNNFWFTQWCASQARNSKPATEESCWISGLILLVLIVFSVAALVWMWWDSRPVDLVQEYKNKNKNKNSKTPQVNTEEEPPNSPPNSGGLGLTGVALSIMAMDKADLTNIFISPKQKKGKKSED